jgi:hypothetical protein
LPLPWVVAPPLVLPLPPVGSGCPERLELKTGVPLRFMTLKSMPMLREAARSISATVTLSMTCCSPGTRSRLMMFGPPATW